MLNTALQNRAFSAINTLRTAVLALQQAKIETASLDARLLLLHVLGVSKEQWASGNLGTLSPAQYADYQDLVEKRASRQPIAQLTGKREFWDLTFKVTCDTLDPRPDSETLIEAVLAARPDMNAGLRILDLGTGTGCLLLTLLDIYEKASGIGVDVSDAALCVAQDNAKRFGFTQRAQFLQSRWDEKIEGVFDIIISNPPYIPTKTIATLAPEVRQFEPMLALDGGDDGLDCYREIIPNLERLLTPGGLAVLEIGMGQEKDIKQMAYDCSLRIAGTKQDLGGITRCVMIGRNDE
jgi:release factor glutamine methyltransferase